VLPLKLLSPPYTAVTVPERLEALNMAAPRLKGAFAKTLPPLRKLIVPVGVPAPGAPTTTVAVSVAFEPFCERVRPVAVLALLMVNDRVLLYTGILVGAL